MSILSATPFLPEGARVWGLGDWPSWDPDRIHGELGALIPSWMLDPPAKREQRLGSMCQALGLSMMLAGQDQAEFQLFLPSRTEGFQWVISKATLPWTWGVAPLSAPCFPRTTNPGTPEEAVELLMAMAPTENDPTGTLATMQWFGFVTAWLAWWEAANAGRLGHGVNIGTLSLGIDGDHAVVATGRRYGPALGSHL